MVGHARRGFTLIELMIVVAILSILSTVAVPAFIKYMRRAKVIEAIDQMDKLHKAAAIYYGRGKVAFKSGEAVHCQFPGMAPMTPDITSGQCCKGGPLDQDGDDRCDGGGTLWDTRVWSALSFEMKDQHYFAYSFNSTGELGDAQYTARANGDLDCDQELSTFERYGYGTADSTYGDCSMTTAPAIYMNMETE